MFTPDKFQIDAVNDVKQVSDYICTKSGGNGAVREFADFIRKFLI